MVGRELGAGTLAGALAVCGEVLVAGPGGVLPGTVFVDSCGSIADFMTAAGLAGEACVPGRGGGPDGAETVLATAVEACAVGAAGLDGSVAMILIGGAGIGEARIGGVSGSAALVRST